MKHVILVKMNGNEISKVQYIESKFDREPGDDMVYDGHRMKVGVVGDSRDSVIKAINVVIKKQNSIKRKIQYQEDKQANNIFNGIINRIWADINR